MKYADTGETAVEGICVHCDVSFDSLRDSYGFHCSECGEQCKWGRIQIADLVVEDGGAHTCVFLRENAYRERRAPKVEIEDLPDE